MMNVTEIQYAWNTAKTYFRTRQEEERKALVQRCLEHQDTPIRVCCYSIFAYLPCFCKPSEVKTAIKSFGFSRIG